MIETDHPQLSVRRQCALLGADRGRIYRPERGVQAEDLELMRWMDEVSLEDPTAGARRCRDLLRLKGQRVSRKRLQRLRRIMGIEAVRPRRTLSLPEVGAQRFAYLLRGLEIVRPNQVWCADITYLPMRGGFMYLTAILDWYSRKVLGWRLSNTLDAQSCLAALEMALASAGCRPEIFNTDQGCQFTSVEWIGRLSGLGIRISMDGKGCWRDNIVVERFWWSLKHEDVYLRDYATVPALHAGVETYIRRYNTWRPHQALGGITPQMAYEGKLAHVA
jgi:putative transposase